MADSDLREILERNRKQLMAVPDVVGVAVGLHPTEENKPAILVYVTLADAWPDGLPHDVEGHAIALIRTAGFHAL